MVEGMESAIPDEFAALVNSNCDEATEPVDTKENIKTETQDSTVPTEPAIKQEAEEQIKQESERTLENEPEVKMEVEEGKSEETKSDEAKSKEAKSEDVVEQALDFSEKKERNTEQALDLSDKTGAMKDEIAKGSEQPEEMDVCNGPKAEESREDKDAQNLIVEKPENLSKSVIFQSDDESRDHVEEDSEAVVKEIINDVVNAAANGVDKYAADVEKSANSHAQMNGECDKDMKEDERASTNEKSLEEIPDPKPGFLNLEGLVPRSDSSSPLIKPYNGGELITADQLSKLPGSKLNGVSDSSNTWFSILPRLPCDENSLTKSESATSVDSSQVETTSTSQTTADGSQVSAATAAAFPAAAFAFNPYIYHMPIPLMPMGQMNSFLGTYAAFPQMAAIPMQQMGPTLNGNGTEEQQAVAMEQCYAQNLIKQEKSEETEEEEEENKAIAQMKAVLAHIEAAKVEPIPKSKSWIVSVDDRTVNRCNNT